ncbi:unnamed protein product [Owenia fusiformis]|uniref:Phospholipid-transporting ATPase n=1 Tax=Owenia fusiformis TaxID=6347 RepID=A0A8S4N9F0_OWEFU|nr:unnamed protein product [Owenia fusiformis]
MGNLNGRVNIDWVPPWRNTVENKQQFRIVEANHVSDTAVHPTNQPYLSNQIRTAKYTILNFIPKNLFEQFHRFANIYFLFVICLNFVPQVGAFGKFLAPIPLVGVLAVTAIKDGFENYRRYKSDQEVNNQTCRVFSKEENKYVKRRWKDIRVGDLVHLSCNEVIPADILILRSKEDYGICKTETANLDGETNLKQRQSVRGLNDVERVGPVQFTHRVQCELPNAEIYKFHGSIVPDGAEKIPLTKDNILIRGCTLRNTDFVEGLVLYAGHDTKAMLNNTGPRYKCSKLERFMNRSVIWCVILLALLCIGGAIGSSVWQGHFPQTIREQGRVLFIPSGPSPQAQGFIVFWTYIIILQVLIPLSLYVSLELVKLGQIFFLYEDIHLYHAETNKRLEPRALNITEDLGQVEVILSDKTGTLTENKMEFKKCSIGGVSYEAPPAEIGITPLSGESSRANSTVSASESSASFKRSSKHDVNEDLMDHITNLSLESLESQDHTCPELYKIHHFAFLLAICNTVVVSSHPHYDKMNASGLIVDDATSLHKDSLIENTMKNSTTKEHNTTNDQSQPQLLRFSKFINSPKLKRKQIHDTPHASSQCYETVDPMSLGDNRPSRNTQQHDTECASESGNSSSVEVDKLLYESESPDELALVQVASQYGVSLLKRSIDMVHVAFPNGDDCQLEILDVLPFDSVRKCMSVIFKHPISGDIILYCKGADSIIMHRLAQPPKEDLETAQLTELKISESSKDNTSENGNLETNHRLMISRSEEHIHDYANLGLRTLCMAMKIIPYNQYKSWHQRYQDAVHSFEDREHKVLACYNEIEQGLNFLGATAIEDKLQEGVEETVRNLQNAGISIWVLTGDKQETAINVAHSCKLITPDHSVLVLNAADRDEASDLIHQTLDQFKYTNTENGIDNCVFYLNEASNAKKGSEKAISGPSTAGKYSSTSQTSSQGIRTSSKGNMSRQSFNPISSDQLSNGIINPVFSPEEGLHTSQNGPSFLTSTEEVGNSSMNGETPLSALRLTNERHNVDERNVNGKSNGITSNGIVSHGINGLNGSHIELNVSESVDQSKTGCCPTGKHKSKTIKHNTESLNTHSNGCQHGPNKDSTSFYHGDGTNQVAMVIDGKTLQYALEGSIQKSFLDLTQRCSTIICCRTTPAQKGEIVKLVRFKQKKHCLAIGDGANDVNMIQTADIGIGISGQEGMQAVMASDFSLAQFRFIERLLLVHGHWSYDRLALTALHMFYKNAVLIFTIYWYQFFNGFTGSTMMDQVYLLIYNLIFTGLPPIIYGIFNTTVPDHILMAQPALYKHGAKSLVPGSGYSLDKGFFFSIAEAFYHSIFLFFIPYAAYAGSDVGIWEFGTTVTVVTVIVPILNLGLQTTTWNVFTTGAYLSSIAAMYVTLITFSIGTVTTNPPSNPYWVMMRCVTSPLHWFTILLVIPVCLLPRYGCQALLTTLKNMNLTPRTIVQSTVESIRDRIKTKPHVYVNHSNDESMQDQVTGAL